MTHTRSMLCGFILLMLALAYSAPAGAVPMWSRRYEVPCSMCHALPSLQLTGDGLDFFRRGHRMAGDSFDKNVPDLISAHAEWTQPVEERASTAFESPNFHLHAGGALSETFSAYVDAGINDEFESLYAQYTRARGSDGYFTARAGKLIPTIIRDYGTLLASASTPLVLTDATLGDNPFAPARDSVGVDVGGQWKSVFAQAGVLNGEDVPGQAKVANHKDVYGSLEYRPAGGASGVGLYYHRGGYDLGPEEAAQVFDRYQRTGVLANLTRERFRLAGAYLYGNDEFREFVDSKLRGYYLQADLYLREWIVPFARYDEVKTEIESDTSRVQKLTVGCAVRLFETEVTAGRAVMELSRNRVAGTNTDAALFNLLWAF